MAYELIETVEVGSGGATSIEFTSIPQDGIDLVVLLSLRNERNFYIDSVYVYVNGTRWNIAGQSLSATGTYGVSASGAITQLSTNGATTDANSFSSTQVYFSNYTASSNHPVSIDEVIPTNTSGDWSIALTATNDTVTSGITSLKFEEPGATDNFVQYSSISLYKIY